MISGLIVSQLSLYRRALGVEYERLPGVLQRFHDSVEGGAADGSFRVTRGPGFVRNMLANAMTLPRACDKVTVHLDVKVGRDGERWIRHFGPKRLVTEQWLQNGLLIEAAGPVRFGFRLSADEASLGFATERCWFLGLPLPGFLSPRVTACVTGREDSWLAMVQVEVPVLGVLVRYEGEMIPQRGV